MLKSELLNIILDDLNSKIELAKKSVHAIRVARNNETKSSAGDKFETGRAMMQAELDKSEQQLAHLQSQKTWIENLDHTSNERIGLGSLVITTKGNFYLSIPAGKFIYNNEKYYAISIQSPMGSKLLGKSVGDKIELNGIVEILKIY